MAIITDKFHKASNGTRAEATTLTAQKALGASSISTAALNGWATDTPVDFQLYTTDTSGNIVPGSQSDWTGIVSGTTITQLILTGGSDSIYPIGTIVVCLPTANWADSMVEGILTHANPNGSLIPAAVTTSLTGTTLPANSVATSSLADGAVTTPKLAAGAVTPVKIADSATTWTGWSAANFGTTETSLGTKSVVVPAGCNALEIVGSLRVQNADNNQKDMLVYIRDAGATTNQTHKAYVTNNLQFHGANVPITDRITVTGGTTVTLDLRAQTTNNNAMSGSGKIIIKPIVV